MPLSEQRKGEIALALVTHKFRTSGVRIEPGMLREWKNMSNATGIPMTELVEFFRELIPDTLNNILSHIDNK